MPAISDTEVAATEERLWLAINVLDGCELYTRERSKEFDLVNRLSSRVIHLAPSDDECVLFLADRTIYRQQISQTALTAVRNLPGTGLPIDVSASHGRIYALIDAHTARAIRDPVTESQPSSSPSELGPRLSIALLDNGQWRLLTECPEPLARKTSAGLGPRILAAADQLLVASPDSDVTLLDYAWFDPRTEQWSAVGTKALDETPAAFWLVSVAGTPTLVLSRPSAEGNKLGAFRWLADEGGGAMGWRSTKGEVSGLPGNAKVGSYDHAFGFNQHLGVVARDEQTRIYLCFARFGESPLEPTASVGDAISKSVRALQYQSVFQLFTIVALVIVMVALFSMRRESMTATLALPAGIAPAFLMQRAAAALIDFTPFSLAAARVLNQPLREALSTLGEWTMQTDVTAPTTRPVLLWWGLSCGGYVLYSFLMEMITGRTVGKVLLGLRVVNERGRRTGVLSILVRNLLRLIELFPQFWIFVVLMVWSRNRQRLGDIFARTLVVRGRPTDAPDETDAPTPKEPGA